MKFADMAFRRKQRDCDTLCPLDCVPVVDLYTRRHTPMRRDYVLAAMVIVVYSVSPVAAQNPDDAWPQFRGANASGVAASTLSPPLEFGPTKNQLWKTALPTGHSSPVIWRDRIFLTAVDAVNKRLETIALDRATGAIVWRQATTVEQLERVHVMGNAATATPAVDGERVYAYFGSYGVIAYDLTGHIVWQAPMPVLQNGFGSGTSPALAGSVVSSTVRSRRIRSSSRSTARPARKSGSASIRSRPVCQADLRVTRRR